MPLCLLPGSFSTRIFFNLFHLHTCISSSVVWFIELPSSGMLIPITWPICTHASKTTSRKPSLIVQSLSNLRLFISNPNHNLDIAVCSLLSTMFHACTPSLHKKTEHHWQKRMVVSILPSPIPVLAHGAQSHRVSPNQVSHAAVLKILHPGKHGRCPFHQTQAPSSSHWLS